MIRILEKQVADKIAAGEVIDRPVSIVKELIENAIDAGASNIVVEIKKGGKEYIRITDNGIGIEKDEVEIAFKRHATSKITHEEDLNSIETLGFRGEALASIAAVSKVELITKREKDKTGILLTIEGGEILENISTGCPSGTTFVVKDIFFNVPARHKFMKSHASESGLIIDLVSQIALAYPKIKVRMINNENILFSTSGNDDRLRTIMTLYGKNTGGNLFPVELSKENINLSGYVSGPGESKTTKKGQIFFVNGRVVNSKIIERGLNAAYKERLFHGRHPIAYLFLEVNPEALDVNIHPNKKEVRFDDEEYIEKIICEGVRDALYTKEAIPEAMPEKKAKKTFTKPVERSKSKPTAYDREVSPKIEIKKVKEEQVDVKNILSTFRRENELAKEKVEEITQTAFDKPVGSQLDFSQLNIINVVFSTYILATHNDELYFVDQHAAHERIFYEKFMKEYKSQDKNQQEIMVPIVVNAGFKEESWIEPLEKLGFILEDFGPNTYSVKAIPMFFQLKEAEEFINDYIDTFSETTDFESQNILDKIATKACKASVRAHDILKKEEIIHLIKELSKCDNPYSCPHGRPTFIKLSKHDIERRFKRV